MLNKTWLSPHLGTGRGGGGGGSGIKWSFLGWVVGGRGEWDHM